MGKIALYTGRFQPFHNGHRKVVEMLVETFDLTKIALGEKRAGDILSYSEREEMIRDTFQDYKIELYRIEDLPKEHPEYFNWGNYVLNKVGKVDFVVTGQDPDNYVQDDFFKLGYPIILVPRFEGISGTVIRQKILSGEQSWQRDVPLSSKRIIRDIIKNENK